jgi:hypothetical protein
VTNLGGARNFSGPQSDRTPARVLPPHLLRVPAYSSSHRRRPASKASQPPGSGADRDPRPHSEKGPPAFAWNANRASAAFCRALGDVRLGPEEVPADDPLTSVTSTVEKKPRYDSTTAAAAADTGIRPAAPQRMRHPPRRPPGADHHHRDCDLPRRIRPAWLDFQLTMAARTRRLTVLCDGGGLA